MIDLKKLKISTRLLSEEALSRGWRVEMIAPGYSYVYMYHPDFREPWLLRSTVTDMTSFAAGSLCDNKWAFYCLLNKAGMPLPATQWISYETPDSNQYTDFLQKHKRVVIKPIDTNHGEGIQLNITSVAQIERAIDYTKQFSKQDGCLIQQQSEGKDYRFLVVGGEFIAASVRKPAFVVGNNTHTVLELIEQKNGHPLRGEGHNSALTKINVDKVSVALGSEVLNQVLPTGQELELMAVANLSQGGEAVDMTDVVHPELKALACKVATTLGVGVCGVDIITQDPTKSVQLGNAVVLEANNSPGIRMHHFPSSGQSHNVAKVILDELEKYMYNQRRAS